MNDLEQGLGEIEERASSELGMIGKGETFYQFVGEKIDIPGDNLAGTLNIDESDEQQIQ